MRIVFSITAWLAFAAAALAQDTTSNQRSFVPQVPLTLSYWLPIPEPFISGFATKELIFGVRSPQSMPFAAVRESSFRVIKACVLSQEPVDDSPPERRLDEQSATAPDGPL
jgi:hypothetical protein